MGEFPQLLGDLWPILLDDGDIYVLASLLHFVLVLPLLPQMLLAVFFCHALKKVLMQYILVSVKYSRELRSWRGKSRFVTFDR